MPADDPRSEERLFPIVGIGASAGGLEALDVFLRNVPAKSEIAFIVVQHLEPTQKDFMVELLQRSTAMKVVQVKDRTVVRPACVYVIPPNKEMSILHGVLHLLDRIAPHGVHLPIDFFLRSLADDEKERSVGVILSGMGSDGTFGLRAIKEKGGATFVQDPASSKFDGMPKSAIAGGTADIVAPVEMLPGKIIAYLQRAPLVSKSGLVKADKARSGLEKILILLRDQTGHDFSLYKNIAVYRRIERRMSIHQIDKIATYVRFLQENPQEVGIAVQGAFDRGHRLLPRPWSLGKTEDRGYPGAPERPGSESGAACLGDRLRDRRRSLLAGHRFQGGGGETRASPKHCSPDLCHRSGRGCHRESPRGRFPAQYRRGCVAGAPEQVLYPGRARLPESQKPFGRW